MSPLPPPADLVEAGLRLEVAVAGAIATHGSRPWPALHLGVPGGVRTVLVLPRRPGHSRRGWTDPYGTDRALRVEAAARLVETADDLLGPASVWWAWWVREGDVEAHEADLDWRAALHTAAAEAGRPLDGFRVVTRHGWYDPLTGETRRWRRLRVRSRDGERHVADLAGRLQRAQEAARAGQSQEWTGSLACIRSA